MNVNLTPACPVDITPELLLKAKLAFVFRELTEKICTLAYEEENVHAIKNGLENLLLKIDIPYDENSNWSDPDKIVEKFNYSSSPYIKSDYFSTLHFSLIRMHDGNCTGRAYSCDRCTVEEMLGFSTVSWNKQNGLLALLEHEQKVNKNGG